MSEERIILTQQVCVVFWRESLVAAFWRENCVLFLMPLTD